MTTRLRRVAVIALPGVAYLAASMAIFAHVWSDGAGHTFESGFADPGQEIWFLGWTAHALASGANPFFSPAMFAPKGVNLMANTAFPLLGTLLAPLTLLAGPVVAFDVAVTLAPALSALSAYLVMRRWAPWPMAAALGGAWFGFSPALLGELYQGHLQVTFLALLPVIVALWDDAIVRQHRRPASTGALLGTAVAAQYLVGPEVLAITGVLVALGTVLLALIGPRAVPSHARHGVAAVLTAAAVAGCLLAYPLWYEFAGPRHLLGSIPVSPLGVPLRSVVLPGNWSNPLSTLAGMGYVGIPLLVVIVLGLALVRHDRTLQAAAALGVLALVFALGRSLRLDATGGTTGIPLPSSLLADVELLRQIAPVRFALLAPLGFGTALAVTIERARRRPAALLLALLGAAAGLSLFILNGSLPYPARPVAEPPVYRSLPAGEVLSYPLVSQWVSDPLVWQATEGFRWGLAEGYAYVPGGPSVGTITLGPSPLVTALADAEAGLPVRVEPAAVRRELARLDVSRVVVLKSKGSATVARLLAKALGRPGRREEGGALVFSAGH